MIPFLHKASHKQGSDCAKVCNSLANLPVKCSQQKFRMFCRLPAISLTEAVHTQRQIRN